MSLLLINKQAATKGVAPLRQALRQSVSVHCASQARSTSAARHLVASIQPSSCAWGPAGPHFWSQFQHQSIQHCLTLQHHRYQQYRTGGRTMASSSKGLSLEVVDILNPRELNFILGHAHFIKTVEDLYEALVQSSPALKFGIAFNEASPGYEAMPGRKVRFDGNDEELIELAKKNAMALGAGHTFIIFIDGGFPVNCLNAVKAVPEVCRIHCATANPTSVVIAKTSEDAKGIMGVIDGVVPTDFETEDDKKKRHEFLRMIGYKR